MWSSRVAVVAGVKKIKSHITDGDFSNQIMTEFCSSLWKCVFQLQSGGEGVNSIQMSAVLILIPFKLYMLL